MFSYYADEHWLATSEFLHCPAVEGREQLAAD